MATHMIKVAYEGLVTQASRLAEPGLTNGGASIYEVQGVPGELSIDDVIESFRKLGKTPPKHRDYEVKWADLAV
ncbi:hypothetical protein [Oryzibacter oryziterrae]|uniref:hypothetical protein n=1 Tax=Oryzibacter oryziterrae TaxID=2766474 RepID=UPI001F46A6F5|nr:hypothetical protein [Oryzibacter oryziterrae]